MSPEQRRPFFMRPNLALLLRLACATLLPLLFLQKAWLGMFVRGVPRAWDGVNHYAAALLYRSIFPDTFGYTAAYLHGMPFPNDYPPLLFFFVAALNRLGIPFEVAFKIVACGPQLLIPPLLYLVAWKLSRKDRSVAFWTAVGSVLLELCPILIVPISSLAGIDYLSTFVIGMYSQLLGFVALLLWFLVYNSQVTAVWRFLSAAALLACTLLASFFNATTAALFVVCTLACDLLFRSRPGNRRMLSLSRENWKSLLFHLSSPLLSLLLVAFWFVPVLATYDQFVTRPSILAEMTVFGWIFRLVGVAGAILWLRRGERLPAAFATSWLSLLAIVLLAQLAPHWLPFQAHRFNSTVNMLATVPAGFFFASCMRRLRFRLPLVRRFTTNSTIMAVAACAGLLIAFAASFSSTASLYDAVVLNYGFYPAGKSAPANNDFGSSSGYRDLIALQNYAKAHPDGSYLITFPYSDSMYDARAMNGYLGAQGQHSLLGVYREATPDSLFLYPQVGALSTWSDNYGISATLAEDVDFLRQPLATHLARLQSLGVRFFVTDDPEMKKRLHAEPTVTRAQSTGAWTIFVLGSSDAH